MARRRRKGRSTLRLFALLALGAAIFAVGLWLGRHRPLPWSRAAAPAPAGKAATAPRAPRTAAPAARAEGTQVEELPGPAPQARVAIVIDDLGRSIEEVERLIALGAPLTGAVLPGEPRTAAVAARLRAAGIEVLVHLPMEAIGGENPGADAILERQRPERVAALTAEAIDAVPGAVGLNNHMGSRITADDLAMDAILGVVARRKLFFLDSRTSAETHAFDLARARGIAAARRDVFLDDDPAPAAIAAQFARLLERARAHGSAVAIGHPHPATLALLARELPRARAAGIELVPVSYLLERSETLPE